MPDNIQKTAFMSQDCDSTPLYKPFNQSGCTILTLSIIALLWKYMFNAVERFSIHVTFNESRIKNSDLDYLLHIPELHLTVNTYSKGGQNWFQLETQGHFKCAAESNSHTLTPLLLGKRRSHSFKYVEAIKIQNRIAPIQRRMGECEMHKQRQEGWREVAKQSEDVRVEPPVGGRRQRSQPVDCEHTCSLIITCFIIELAKLHVVN